MLISQLIKELQYRMQGLGDVEVTCTGTTLSENTEESNNPIPAVFESTVESTMVTEGENGNLNGKRVRILW